MFKPTAIWVNVVSLMLMSPIALEYTAVSGFARSTASALPSKLHPVREMLMAPSLLALLVK